MNLYYTYFLKHFEKNSNIVSDFGGLLNESSLREN